MPTPGLSLVGFMDETPGIEHLQRACIPPDPTNAALKAAWQSAKGILGAPTAKAGNPDIEPIPASHAHYMLQLMQLPWVVAGLAADLAGATFQMIEIDPLLAFQLTVDTDRGAYHCAGVSSPPTIDEMLVKCLPLMITPEPIQVSNLAQSMMIRCRNANFRIVRNGALNDPMGNLQGMGVLLAMSLPFVHVVRFNGRCYLHNGYHRSVALRMAGATKIPCIFRDVHTAEAAGIRADGSTFPESLLTGADPPTVGHFTNNRAHAVSLREHARVINVSWSEYLAYEE
jgi:hypothetical protein